MQELTIKQKLTNYYCFVTINSLIAVFIGVFYFLSPWRSLELLVALQGYILMLVFSIMNHISIIILLSFIISLVGLPILFASKLIRITLQAGFASIALFLLLSDTHIFFTEGIHLIDFFSINLSLFFVNDKFKITHFFDIYKIIVFILFYIIECLLLCWLDKNLWIKRYQINKKIIQLIIVCFIVSQSIYYVALHFRKDYIISNSVYLPWYNQHNNIKTTQEWQQLTNYNNNKINDLNYPLKPLTVTPVNQPKNILIISIDAWRADCFNKEACPNLWNLAQNGTVFNKHMSGANFTRQGLFSLFYGMPATYLTMFLQHQRSPVFIDRLQQLNYQIGVFISANLQENKLDKATFSKIDNLRLKSQGDTPAELDDSSTNDWLSWFNNIDKTAPFFSFVFYFSVHEHDFPTDFNSKNIPTGGKIKYADLIAQQSLESFKQGYKTSVQYVDSLASKIITALKQTNTLKNTLIIITSDHGHELNDQLQNNYGHGDNLTDCQLHVPFAIIGTDFNNKHVNKLTTHYDFVPTIMKNFLGVNNDIADYSIGYDLFDTKSKQNWHMSTNYRLSDTIHTVGIITKDYIQQYFPSGKFTLMNKHKIPIQIKSSVNNNYLPEVIEYMTRFIKK